jgi:hypothetical protein
MGGQGKGGGGAARMPMKAMKAKPPQKAMKAMKAMKARQSGARKPGSGFNGAHHGGGELQHGNTTWMGGHAFSRNGSVFSSARAWTDAQAYV